MDEIELFIKDIKSDFPEALEFTFYRGYCYWFAFILSNRFKGEIWFNPVDVHFACMVNDNLYDIYGKIEFKWDSQIGEDGSENWISWEEFQYKNQEAVENIVDSCIKKVR